MVFERISFLWLAILLYFFSLLFLWKKQNLWKIFQYSIIYFYISFVIAFAFFPIMSLNFRTDFVFQFVPFDIFREASEKDFWEAISLILSRFILLLPAGFIIPIIYEKFRNFKNIFILGISISFLIEMFQFTISAIIWPYKVVNIDEFILNTLWFFTWFILYKIFFKYFENKKPLEIF